MAFDYINEAFKRLDTLEENIFKTSYEGINKLTDFVEEDDKVDETVRVIDPNADDAEALEDSYVGKVIINCNVCHSHIFEDKDEITIDEDGAVNVDMQCPYCGETEGFVIIGEIAPYGEAPVEESEPAVETAEEVEETEITETDAPIEESLETDTDFEVTEETDAENKSLSMSRATRRVMSEDFKEVSITTEDQKLEMSSDENGKVTVTTEPVETAESVAEETIVPVSDETEEAILSNNEVDTEEDTSFEDTENETEFTFDDADEEGLDELGEAYLKRVYENVESFKTTAISTTPTQLIVEGTIRFTSGAEKKTGFIFEAKDANSKGQLRFVGTNKHLTEAADAFCLIGRVDNKKLFVESFKYNYSISDSAVRGLVRRK